MRLFTADKDVIGKVPIAWNYAEFEVSYNSLADEIKIGALRSRRLFVLDVNLQRTLR